MSKSSVRSEGEGDDSVSTLLRLTKATMKFDVKLTVVISSGFAVNM